MMRPMTATPIPWPKALIPSLRLLWQRTLFPSTAPVDARIRILSLLILFVLPAALLYPCLQFHLLDPDEGRYAEIPREMLARGEWIVPHLQGEPYLDKPPLLYWLVMLSYSIFGVYDWAARLVPALCVHATILTTYLIGRNRLGERAAFRGALLLSLTPALIGMGRLLIIDGLLTVWVTLGLLAGWSSFGARSASKGTWILCALACGLGVLTKGPVALILVLPPLLIFRWLQPEPRNPISDTRPWLLFAAIILAINLPWYIAIAIRRPEFGLYFFVQHNLQRFLAPFDHLEPIWYYGPVVLAGLLPGTFLLWRLARTLISGDPDACERRTADLGFALLAGGWCVLFFSLSGSKLPTYILPAFPMLCLALGVLRPMRGSVWVLGCWIALLIVANYVAVPWYARQRSPMGVPAAELRAHCSDPAMPVCCYPRSCDSAGFYLQRDDLQATRSKFVHLLIADLLTRDRTAILFTHRHSFDLLKESLPPELTVEHAATFRGQLEGPIWLTKWMGDSPWGLCDLAVIHNSRPRAANEVGKP
jgi:4-amino-4-deoxy-L-arabinose transferase-like glycosyltransferase